MNRNLKKKHILTSGQSVLLFVLAFGIITTDNIFSRKLSALNNVCTRIAEASNYIYNPSDKIKKGPPGFYPRTRG